MFQVMYLFGNYYNHILFHRLGQAKKKNQAVIYLDIQKLSEDVGSSTAGNKEYLKIFPHKKLFIKILLNKAVLPRNLLDPRYF